MINFFLSMEGLAKHGEKRVNIRKKKSMKALTWALGLILISISVLIVYLIITFNVHYIYRYAFWTPPGNADIQKFPSREIHHSDEAFQFTKILREEYIESLFEDRLRNLGVDTFGEYIEKAGLPGIVGEIVQHLPHTSKENLGGDWTASERPQSTERI